MTIIDRFFAADSGFQKNFFFLAKRFVPGEHIADALHAVTQLNRNGMSASLDFLGEDVLDRRSAIGITDTYLRILDGLRETGADCNVSVKLTALGVLIDEDFAVENLLRIVRYAHRNTDPFVRIDMEGSALTAMTLSVFERVFATESNVGIVLQSSLKRTATDVDRAIELGARVRLCKGAYDEPPDIAYRSSDEIRAAYVPLAQRLLLYGNYPGIATHDRRLITAIREFAVSNAIARDRFEFQMLYGCRPQLQQNVVAAGYRLRVYVPFGTHWAAYFYRRVAERPQNALFALSSIFSR